MRAEVGRKLNAMKQDLFALGDERSAPEQQRGFLLDVVTKFQEIVSQAMTTSYCMHALFEKDEDFRLATQIRNRMDTFKSDMDEHGVEYQFDTGTLNAKCSSSEDDEDEDGDDGNDEISVRKNTNVSENRAIDDILQEQEFVNKPKDDSIIAWIEEQCRASRGFEIGTFQSSLLCTIMNKQTGKWTIFALGYVSDVIVIMHTFMLKVLHSICPEEQIRDKLVFILVDELSKRYQEAMDQARLIRDVERVNMMTLDDKFHDTLDQIQKRRHARLIDSIF